MNQSGDKATVCHISTVHPTFDQRIFHRECWTLANAGYQTHLIVEAEQSEEVEGIRIHAVDQPRKVTPGAHLPRRLRRLREAKKLAIQLDADIYHLHDPELMPLGSWLKKRTDARVIFDSHENNVGYIKQKAHLPKLLRKWVLQPMMTGLERKAARTLDAIVAADQGVARIFKDDYQARRVETIHNFPRLDLFLTDSIEQGNNWPEVDLVYHGSIPEYHLEVTFAVAEELRKIDCHATWSFFGRGASAEWVEQQVRQRNLQDLFHYDPVRIPHEQVAARVSKAKLGFIPLPDLPKFQDNIPTKLFEFMALGMPVVLSDLPPSRPFVGDGAAAVMVAPDDYAGYAREIARLLRDDELRHRMGQHGKKLVVDQFNWASESQLLLDLYDSLLR